MYMGNPDGPRRFVETLGEEVPTYIDPRDDLKTKSNPTAHVSVDYHIPPPLRGTYEPKELANYDPNSHYPLTNKGTVQCTGIRKGDGSPCRRAAQNRTGVCAAHGGALHPADKLYSAARGIAPTDVERLSRLEKVMCGVIPLSELSDEEISRQMIRDDDGTWVKPLPKIAPKLNQQMHAEFFKRANDYIRTNTLDMLKVMVEIANSNANEPADRQKAAQWMVERSLGKTPDVLLTNKTDKPFEQLFTDIVSGSREEYRQSVRGELSDPNVIDGEIVIIDQEDEEDDDEHAVDGGEVPESAGNGSRAETDHAGTNASASSQSPGSAIPDNRNGIGHHTDRPESNDDSYSNVVGRNGTQPVFDTQIPGNADDAKSGIRSRDRDNQELNSSGVVSDPVPLTPEQIALERKKVKERIIAARKRRYAARSKGLNTTDNLWFDIEFKRELQDDGSYRNRMRVITPDRVKLPKTR